MPEEAALMIVLRDFDVSKIITTDIQVFVDRKQRRDQIVRKILEQGNNREIKSR
jgi:hypothetical protein